MRQASWEFLERMLDTPSASGYEQPVQGVVREYAAEFADEVRTDVHGSVIAARNPGARVRVMLAGHCDQIGLMVQHAGDDGMIRFSSIGGADPTVVVGSQLTVYGTKGPVPGVVGRKAIHLMSEEDRKAGLQLKDLWLDIGVKDKKEALKLVEIGDPITYRLGSTRLQQDLVAAPGMDDKVGVYVVMEALRLVPKSKLKCGVFAVSTVQEEIGLRGARTSAFGIDPHAGIAVDVTHATDYPAADANQTGEVKLKSGPTVARGANINPPLRDIIVKAAKDKKIPYQNQPAPGGTGTDANAIQVNRAGVAAALISIPNRYMHTAVEVVSLADLDNAAKLIAEALTRIDEKTDFTPR